MTYQETLQWLFTQLPVYQLQGTVAYKGDLKNTFFLDEYFGHPHRKFKTIHVAGTNGKGSVSHTLASILQEAGYKVGLYTSPHLKDFRERIKINGAMIPEQFVMDFVTDNLDMFMQIKPSFFEMTVAMAFNYFAEQQIDVAVVEVGLGGRLDSTNIITPEASVITNIGMDHMALLGNTLAKIAFEKAGIIKSGIPAIAGIRESEYDMVFEQKAAECNAPLSFASDVYRVSMHDNGNMDFTSDCRPNYLDVECELKGFYQQKNLVTVLETVHTLRERHFEISDGPLRRGIAKVVANTGLLGRWQKLSDTPYTVCDTGHNAHGITEITAQLAKCHYKRLHIVIGMVNDKDVNAVLRLLPKEAEYYFCKAGIARAMNEHILAEKAATAGLHGRTFATVAEAYQAARQAASPDDMIYIGGSTFVVAEII